MGEGIALMGAGLMGMANNWGGSMGLFGSKHGNASSTTSSKTWDADEIEDFLTNDYNPSIYYENEKLASIPESMQKILDYESSFGGANAAKSVFGKGKGLMSTAVADYQKLAGITGDDLLTEFKNLYSQAYSGASGYMDKQNEAIQNEVMTSMGGELAQNATMQNAGGAVAGSSAANNSAMGIQEAGAESMEKQEADIAGKVGLASATGAAGAIRGGLRAKANQIGVIGGAATALMGTGAEMGSKVINNAWQSGIFEMGYNQKQNNVNRKNDMINKNLPLVEQQMWLETMLQAQGIDTTSTTNTKY